MDSHFHLLFTIFYLLFIIFFKTAKLYYIPPLGCVSVGMTSQSRHATNNGAYQLTLHALYSCLSATK